MVETITPAGCGSRRRYRIALALFALGGRARRRPPWAPCSASPAPRSTARSPSRSWPPSRWSPPRARSGCMRRPGARRARPGARALAPRVAAARLVARLRRRPRRGPAHAPAGHDLPRRLRRRPRDRRPARLGGLPGAVRRRAGPDGGPADDRARRPGRRRGPPGRALAPGAAGQRRGAGGGRRPGGRVARARPGAAGRAARRLRPGRVGRRRRRGAPRPPRRPERAGPPAWRPAGGLRRRPLARPPRRPAGLRRPGRHPRRPLDHRRADRPPRRALRRPGARVAARRLSGRRYPTGAEFLEVADLTTGERRRHRRRPPQRRPRPPGPARRAHRLARRHRPPLAGAPAPGRRGAPAVQGDRLLAHWPGRQPLDRPRPHPVGRAARRHLLPAPAPHLARGRPHPGHPPRPQRDPLDHRPRRHPGLRHPLEPAPRARARHPPLVAVGRRRTR